MSLRLTGEVPKLLPFPQHKNVRVLISGLALCKFDIDASNIRFLRHVQHHDLIMKITKIRESDMTVVLTEPPITLHKTQNVEISGSISTPPNSVIHDPNLSHLISMRKLHGNGSNIGDKPTLPNDRPSFLKLHHSAFYTHKQTDDPYIFTDCNGNSIGNSDNFCEYLGGYMNYGGNLLIAVNNLPGSPLTYPLNGFLYEIEFTNHCNNNPACLNNEDFRFNYDILEDKNHPTRKYCLVNAKLLHPKLKRESPDTAACLPVCEVC